MLLHFRCSLKIFRNGKHGFVNESYSASQRASNEQQAWLYIKTWLILVSLIRTLIYLFISFHDQVELRFEILADFYCLFFGEVAYFYGTLGRFQRQWKGAGLSSSEGFAEAVGLNSLQKSLCMQINTLSFTWEKSFPQISQLLCTVATPGCPFDYIIN